MKLRVTLELLLWLHVNLDRQELLWSSKTVMPLSVLLQYIWEVYGYIHSHMRLVLELMTLPRGMLWNSPESWSTKINIRFLLLQEVIY